MSYLADITVPGSRCFHYTREHVDEENVTATAVWKVPWTARTDWVSVASGAVEVLADGVAAIVPLRYPDNTNLIAESIDVEGWGAESTPGAFNDHLYEWAKITVNFRQPPFPVSGDEAFIERQARVSEYFQGFPALAIKVNGKCLPTNASIPMSVTELVYTRHFVPSFEAAHAKLQAYSNRLNLNTFAGYDPGYVRFVTGTVNQRFNFAGEAQTSVSYVFHARTEASWNHLLADDGQWYQAVVGASGTLYQKSDLADLFNFTA